MNTTFNEVPNFNWDFEAMLSLPEYWQDFRPATASVHVPVLYFHGLHDWMTGPQHYCGALFPDVLLWSSDVGHMPFLENKKDLEQSIACYCEKNAFSV
jgi:proline iminopeptidase